MMNDDEMRWGDVIQATSILPDWLLLICSGDMKKKNENRSTATANKWVPLESIIIVQQSIGPRKLSGSSLNKPPDPLAGEHWTTPTRPPSVQARGSGTAIQQSHVSKAAALTLIDFGSNFKPTPHNRFGQSIGELKQQREEGANHWGIQREYRESHPECTESTANVFVILIGGWEQQEEMVVSL